MREPAPSPHDAHARRCAPNDFWGQVRRTVGGVPVGEDQIALIEQAIVDGLRLGRDDFVLDLCCGNGALSDRIFRRCRGGVGVDSSPHLIDIARHNFAHPPERTYQLGDVVDTVTQGPVAARATRALCYGAFQYLPADGAGVMLTALHRRFPTIARLFVGNLPDRALMSAFYQERGISPHATDDPISPIGIWRTMEEFAALAAAAGWRAQFSRMPAFFYAAHYRYDAVLIPLSGPVEMES